MRAFVEGVLAGFGIAIPVGPIAVLIVDLGTRRGFPSAFAAGLGAATADLTYATVAAVVGLAASRALDPVEDPLRAASVVALVAIVALRTLRLFRPASNDSPTGPDGGRLRTYLAFLGLTLLNPVTVTYFAALVLGLQVGVADGSAGKLLFVSGAFLASASWQTGLAGLGAVFHRRLGDGARVLTGLLGNVVIVAFAIRLALSPG
ncbi:MAG TPA: LysE family transporter [Actinomycetota bacterium]|nr:LysE family transporter [Actinomycetota bacterium]